MGYAWRGPGIHDSKPPPAKAAVVVAIKIASVTATRMPRSGFPRNLIETRAPRVEAADQLPVSLSVSIDARSIARECDQKKC